MIKKRRLLGTGAFSREVGGSPQGTRNLVRRGVLEPEFLTDGSMIFTDEHVTIAKEYKARSRKPAKDKP